MYIQYILHKVIHHLEKEKKKIQFNSNSNSFIDPSWWFSYLKPLSTTTDVGFMFPPAVRIIYPPSCYRSCSDLTQMNIKAV